LTKSDVTPLGFPAILTPQLRENGSEFTITENDESWIGKKT